MLLGVDTGGTFTDFVLLQGSEIKIHKVLSTPAAPEQAILQGITELNLDAAVNRGQVTIVHGSTVATNAALEGKGVRTAFIGNRGFKDLLSIGRQTRRELYNLQPAVVQPPVAAELCLEADCRIDASGRIVTELASQTIDELKQQLHSLQPEAVAINLLFSYLNDEHERQLQAALSEDYFVSRSSFVLPEYKEYERGIATWLSAYLGPLVNRYLGELQQAVAPSPLAVMQSSGGTISADQAAQRAVNLLLSGPAGGLAAAKYIGEQAGIRGLMTFDMGGTSTDVALIEDELRLTNEGKLGPYPVAVPMVDMHTIGAGGGSIAYLDAGGLLQVGPQSAGADPGPACYGRGGQQATVTDANVVLGRIRPDALLAGNLKLDVDAARQAVANLARQLSPSGGSSTEPLSAELSSVEKVALGIVQLADEHMVRALRVISVQRGHDPQQFHLCSFGGAGGLHVCDLAESLNMSQAVVPRLGGVLSALGMLVAPRERQLSHTLQQLLADMSSARVKIELQRLLKQGRHELQAEGIKPEQMQNRASLDLRYQGQSYAINIGLSRLDDVGLRQAADEFHHRHEKLYGHQLQREVELVTLRQRVYSPPAQIALPAIDKPDTQAHSTRANLYEVGETQIVSRQQLAVGEQLPGPLLIVEDVATTLVKPGWQVQVDSSGSLLLSRINP